MKFHIAYRFTGADPEEVKQNIQKICTALETAGHSVFCSFWSADFYRANNYDHKKIMEHVFSEIDKADATFAFIENSAIPHVLT